MTAAFSFRPLRRDDFPTLLEWLSRPHVREWWGWPTTPEEVEADYAPTLDPGSPHRAYLAILDGEPLGFIQSYDVMGAQEDGWWPDETDPGARGIDQFLADEHRLGRGLGSAMVRAFVDRLFEDPAVTKVQTDPSPDNARAIRAYEKAGFSRVGVLDTPDGPALLMVRER
jgi:RimJ/RimL family protein N-acetyltransferase